MPLFGKSFQHAPLSYEGEVSWTSRPKKMDEIEKTHKWATSLRLDMPR